MRIPKAYASMSEEEYRQFKKVRDRDAARLRVEFATPEMQAKLRSIFGEWPPRSRPTSQHPTAHKVSNDVVQMAKEVVLADENIRERFAQKHDLTMAQVDAVSTLLLTWIDENK